MGEPPRNSVGRGKSRPRQCGQPEFMSMCIGFTNVVDDQRLDHCVEHSHPRIERFERILKDHLKTWTQPSQVITAQWYQINTVEDDSSGGAVDQPHYRISD